MSKSGVNKAQKQQIEVACDEYIRLLSAYKRRWALHAKGDLTDDYSKAKLVAELSALGNPFKAEDIEQEFGIALTDGRDSMIQLGRILMESLSQDVIDCLSGDELDTFDRCELRMIEIGETNALCSNQAADGTPLPGFIILVNQGLYFCIKLLVTAQIYADMQGDYTQYQQSGDNVFAAALNLFLTETPEKIDVGVIFTGNEEVDGTIEAHVSLGSILLLQFVVLHEIGHAHLGHSESLGRGRLSALAAAGQSAGVGSPRPYHDAEFEADAFAWSSLASRANDPLKNLGNLYVIRLFFGFLDTIESTLGRPICPYHPAPKSRSDRLISLFAPDGLTDEHKELFDRQDSILKSWSKAAAHTGHEND